MAQRHIKDPDDVMDYGFTWTAWLAGDTISTSTWTAENGITVVSESESTTSTTVWLSGGTAGTTYDVTNRIITAAGRTKDLTLTIDVMNR